MPYTKERLLTPAEIGQSLGVPAEEVANAITGVNAAARLRWPDIPDDRLPFLTVGTGDTMLFAMEDQFATTYRRVHGL